MMRNTLLSVAVLLSVSAIYAQRPIPTTEHRDTVVLSSVVQGVNPEKEYMDTIIMKNGTVYEGFISEQSTKGDVWIKAATSTMTFDRDSISINSTEGSTTVSFKKQLFNDVTILEDGDIVTFRCNYQALVQTKMSEVDKVLKPVVPNVLDVVTADKTYEGSIVETAFGRYLKILSGDKKHVIKSKNIKSQSRKTEAEGRENLDVTLFPYLDVYEMKDKSVVSGILISQNMSDGSLIFKTENGTLLPLNLKNIDKVRKVVNNNYKEVVYPIDTAAMADLYINDFEVEPLQGFYDKKTDIVSVPVEMGSGMILIPGKDVTLCQKEKAKAKMKEYILVPFNPLESVKNGLIRLGKTGSLSFVNPTVVEKQDGLVYTDYKNLNAGYYILYDKKDQMIIPLWVRAAEN